MPDWIDAMLHKYDTGGNFFFKLCLLRRNKPFLLRALQTDIHTIHTVFCSELMMGSGAVPQVACATRTVGIMTDQAHDIEPLPSTCRLPSSFRVLRVSTCKTHRKLGEQGNRILDSSSRPLPSHSILTAQDRPYPTLPTLPPDRLPDCTSASGSIRNRRLLLRRALG